MLKKMLYINLLLLNFLFAKEENVMLYEGQFQNHIYQGNIENGKLNGNGAIYCEKINRIFINGYFENNTLINGILQSCDDKSLKNEIKYGIINKVKYEREYTPFYNVELAGDFNGKLFNNNMDFKITFTNTQSYDYLIGKSYSKDNYYYVNGTLFLLNNYIKEIKGKFKITNLNFDKGKIQIKGNDFIMEGYVKDGDNINNFTFDGLIKWNDDSEYYITNIKFKEDLLEKIRNFKKLSINNNEIIENKKLNIETNLINQNKETLKTNTTKINTENVKYKDNKYNNNLILDLEKK